MNQQVKGLLWVVLAVCVGFVFAVGLPYFANLVPWSVEKRLAVYVGGHPNICDSSAHPEAGALFKKIVGRIYPIFPTDASFPVTVDVVRGSTINAFAGLGGHIYIYEGLIRQADSADELAGVIAHEIEHVHHRHILQSVLVRLLTSEAVRLIFFGGKQMGPEIARLLLNMNFSREQEFEADDAGLQRLRQAHVDVSGLERFFERSKKLSDMPAFLSDHPSGHDRAELAQKYRSGLIEPIMDEKDWRTVQLICD